MKQTNTTNTTTPATVKVTTIDQKKEVDARNTKERKARRDATVSALLKLYADDKLKALSECKFKRNRKESPVLTTFEWTREKVNTDREIEKETATGEIAFDIMFFSSKDKATRDSVNSLIDKVAYTATAKPDRATATDGRKHVDDVREIVRLCGFGILSDSVNPTTVSIMMNDARFTTGKGNRQFDPALAKLSLFGFLWSTATKTPTESAYIRDREQKKREQERREKERKERREKERKTKQGKKATAPKKDATPAK